MDTECDAALLRMSHDHQQQQWGVDTKAPQDAVAVDAQLLRDSITTHDHRCHGSSIETQHHQQQDSEWRLLRPESSVRVIVALFRDGFVCRHFTEARESVEGFAQPFDVDGSYFLGCIERGVLPDGLVDLIGRVDCNSSTVSAEIWDYRESSVACPVSSVALPRESSAAEQSRDCKVSEMLLLRPPESSNNNCSHHADVFDHFPELSSVELEILAGDAERQLLEVGIPSAWSEPKTEPDRSADLDIQGGTWINVERAPNAQGPIGILTSSSCSARLNLVLDQDAFPTLALSCQHSAFAALLSPTEPKRQVINKAQRQQVARQKKRTVPGKGKSKSRIEILNQEKVRPVGSELLEKTLTKERKEPTKLHKTSSSRSPKSTETSSTPESPTPPPLAVSRKVSTRKKRVSNCSPSPINSNSKSPVDTLSHYASLPPFPAMQHFLLNLKGKRQRPSFEELQYGMPVRLTINHIGIFFHAATRFERQHAFFLHTNVKRLMHPDEPIQSYNVSPVGSMNYLAQQLGCASNPVDVIQVARINQTVGPDEQSDTWGTALTASAAPIHHIVSSEVERFSPQAYPIQLSPLSSSSMNSDSELESGASLYTRWLALADP